MPSLSALLASTTPELALAIPDDWAQGRSAFGGLQAAFAVRAMRTLEPTAPLRSLQVTFVAPIAGRMHATATLLRRGSSATQVEARIRADDGTIACIAIGVFGTARPSKIALVPATPPPLSNPGAPELPFIPNVTPAFIQHFRARWLRGNFPYMGGSAREHTLELAVRDPDEHDATEAHVIAFADFVPPIALTWLAEFAFGSTVTWMLELLADRFEHHALAGWRLDAELVAARDGYTNQSILLYAPDGTPIARGHQAMVVFA